MININIEEKIEKFSKLSDKLDELNFEKQDIEEDIRRSIYAITFDDILDGKIKKESLLGFDIPPKFYPFFSLDKYSFLSQFKNKLTGDCRLEVYKIDPHTIDSTYIFGYILSLNDFTCFEATSSSIGKMITKSKIVFYEKINSDIQTAKKEFLSKHLPSPGSLNNSVQAIFSEAIKNQMPIYSRK